MRRFFFFFFISGFCSVLYEIIWLRLAMAQFGVTSALVSIVLSAFMAGLGLGSWMAGRLIHRLWVRFDIPPLRIYALTELLIGFSAFLVPQELHWGRGLLERSGLSSSGAYYLASGAAVALTLVPWCAVMGATIPVAMLSIKIDCGKESSRSFSFLYLSNVLGAVGGSILPLFFIELAGFRGALKIGAVLNFLIALSALGLTLRQRSASQRLARNPSIEEAPIRPSEAKDKDRALLLLLFGTGFSSMGLEVVWVRQLTPYLGTMVYTFASILGTYLAATFVGSQIYRWWDRRHGREPQLIWALLGLFAVLPLLAANPELHINDAWRVAIGIVPFSCVLGFVTPMLVDRWSAGDPNRAGFAYAINIIGCILGPLAAGFLLLPLMSERWVLLALALPWLGLGLRPGWSPIERFARAAPAWQSFISFALVFLGITTAFTNKAFEDQFTRKKLLRDNTATSIATGEGMQKRLLVNGIGMTALVPTTKMMAHLPLAFLDHAPQDALVVCFGMGTTFRSLLSWGISVTAVELVPSVPQLFGYFHQDGPELLRSPKAHVVIDDGRRYLERTLPQYDVIAIDPPPPVSAAGSSLLYSKEFYQTLKQHLRPGGVLQQWLPGKDPVVRASAARALKESFPYVRAFRCIEGSWGIHFLASTGPIPGRTSKQLLGEMPAAAIKDMMEWGPEPDANRQLGAALREELSLDQLIAPAPETPALTDDRPVNEYFLFRSMRKK